MGCAFIGQSPDDGIPRRSLICSLSYQSERPLIPQITRENHWQPGKIEEDRYQRLNTSCAAVVVLHWYCATLTFCTYRRHRGACQFKSQDLLDHQSSYLSIQSCRR